MDAEIMRKTDHSTKVKKCPIVTHHDSVLGFADLRRVGANCPSLPRSPKDNRESVLKGPFMSLLGLEPDKPLPESGTGNSKDATMADLYGPSETSVWSFRGRISRKPFWGRWLAITVIGQVVLWTLNSMFSVLDPWYLRHIPLFAVQVPLQSMMLAACMKRWHDLNRSGWMTLLYAQFLPVVYVGSIMNEYQVNVEDLGRPILETILNSYAVVGFVLFFGGLIWLGCIKGTKGPNRYGNEPG